MFETIIEALNQFRVRVVIGVTAVIARLSNNRWMEVNSGVGLEPDNNNLVADQEADWVSVDSDSLSNVWDFTHIENKRGGFLRNTGPFEVALSKVEEAISLGSRDLILDNLGLESEDLQKLLPYLLEIKNLKNLDLKGNNLTSLPDNFFQLKDLVVLDLGYNQLTTLPEGLENLDSLQELYLDDNLIIDLSALLINKFNHGEVFFQNNPFTKISEAWMLKAFGRELPKETDTYWRVLNQLNRGQVEESHLAISKLGGRYLVNNNRDSPQKTGFCIIKKFLINTGKLIEKESNYAGIAKIVINFYLDQVVGENEEQKGKAICEMATSLGNCDTPVRSLIIAKAISLFNEKQELFKNIENFDVFLERIALEEAIKKLPNLPKEEIEFIETVEGFLNAVYMKGAEERSENKIKIKGERKRLSPASGHDEFAFNQIQDKMIPPFVKMTCKTREDGEPILEDGMYIIDQTKLDNIKNTFLSNNNLIDPKIEKLVKNAEDNWNKKLSTDNAEGITDFMVCIEDKITRDKLSFNNDKLRNMLLNNPEKKELNVIVDEYFEGKMEDLKEVISSDAFKTWSKKEEESVLNLVYSTTVNERANDAQLPKAKAQNKKKPPIRSRSNRSSSVG